jgi:hypothetical protein
LRVPQLQDVALPEQAPEQWAMEDPSLGLSQRGSLP